MTTAEVAGYSRCPMKIKPNRRHDAYEVIWRIGRIWHDFVDSSQKHLVLCGSGGESFCIHAMGR